MGVTDAAIEEAVTRPGVSFLDRWLVRKAFNFLRNPPVAAVLWNGEEIHPEGVEPLYKMRFRSRTALYRLLGNPNQQLGELYSGGDLDVEGDLVRFFHDLYLTMPSAQEKNPLRWRLLFREAPSRAGSLAGARKNIKHHYDLGNAFYQLWLDRDAMQYTCAYFPRPDMSLEQAQTAKMHHICRKLGLKPGEHVVEAGCGWGGLALFMAKHYGVKVKAYNISREQVAFARERAAQRGLAEQIEYVEDDYRNIQGEYDAFVSVGMLEHVGKANYRQLGEVLNRCLKDHGRGLIHSIGRNKPGQMNPWLTKRIFPGTYPPTLGEMMEVFEPNAFSVLDVENLRLHYVKTIEHWLARYEAHAGEVRALYDETFLRMWRFFLASSIPSFTTGSLQLFQVLVSRPQNNDLPWSRAHLYHQAPWRRLSLPGLRLSRWLR
jgi:cyclopropane-fatty-acyl-phospholipid synthase